MPSSNLFFYFPKISRDFWIKKYPLGKYNKPEGIFYSGKVAQNKITRFLLKPLIVCIHRANQFQQKREMLKIRHILLAGFKGSK